MELGRLLRDREKVLALRQVLRITRRGQRSERRREVYRDKVKSGM